MATYNGSKFVAAQLESILMQDMRPNEIIICDDRSTDDTHAVVERIAKTSAVTIRYQVNEKNLGFVGNFMQAVSFCEGDIIFLADQDDVWFPNKISTILETFEASNAGIVLHDGLLVDADLRWQGATKFSQARAVYGDLESLRTGALSAFRRPYNRYMAMNPASGVSHDIWLHEVGKLLGERIVVDKALQYVRRHGQNVSASAVSALKSASRVSSLRQEIAHRPAADYLVDIRLAEALAALPDRLALTDCTDPHVREIRGRAAHQARLAAAYARRQDLTDRPSKLQACRMLLSGDYALMRGWKSFVRDLLR